MDTAQDLTGLFSESEPWEQAFENGRIRINGTLTIVDEEGVRVIFQRYEPLFRFAFSDCLAPFEK